MRRSCSWGIPNKGKFDLELTIDEDLLLMALMRKINRRITSSSLSAKATAFGGALVLKVRKQA